MKKLLFITIIFACTISFGTNAQIIDPSASTPSKTDAAKSLIKKSRQQRTLSGILAGGSLICTSIGIIHGLNNLDFGGGNLFGQDLPTRSGPDNSRQVPKKID